ncbi:MAG: PAS domain S-box protein, partial [Melioribacteraceae bacterium]
MEGNRIFPRKSFFSNTPFRIVFIYFTTSFLYIFYSDDLLFKLFSDVADQRMISIFKGWLFISISSILLYQMIKRALKKIVLTEEKLLSSEQYSRMLFEKSPIGLALTRMDGSFVDVNPAYAAIIGRTIEETLTLGYWDITPQSYGDQEKLQLISLEKTGHYGPYEKEYVHKKGHSVPVRLRGSIIEKDGVKYIWSSVEDISERKLSEDLLRKTQKFIQEFMDYSPSVVYAADLDGKIILANKQFEAVAKGGKEEILGSVRENFLPKEIAAEHRANDLKIITSGEAYTFEEENIQHDGKHFYVSSKFPLVNNEGKIYAVGGVSTDITQRKMAEENLRRHEQILRHFIEFSPAAIAMLDRNMNYIIASNRYLSDYKLGNQNIEGRSHYEIFPEVPDRWREIHERCIAGAVEKCDEDPFPRNDGTIDWVRWEIRPWEEHTGEIGGIIIFSEVITERKKTEEALRQSEEKFFKAFQNSPDAVTITRASDGLFVDVNESFYNISGYTRDEVIGRSSLELNLWISDTDRDRYVSQLAENGRVTEFDTSFRTKFGEIRHFILAGEIFELNGEAHILGMIHDVTDRKRAEGELLRTHKQFESTLENMTDGFVALDNNWIYTYVNSRAAKMFGRSPEQLIGKHIWTEFPEAIDQPFYNNYYRARETKENINFEEYYEPWGRWYENRVIPSDDGLSIFFQEITARKNSEQILKESEEKFRKLVEELPNGVLVIDHNGIITGWNHAQEKITGLLSSEVLKKPSWDVQVSLMPGKLITDELRSETRNTILELFDPVNSTYLNKPIERTIRRPDGSLCIVESTVFIYATIDESIAVTISSDITAR